MAFEQEHTEELEQLQKQKENERIQQELDLTIARIENEQIQRELDAAIERLEEERSKNDAIIENEDQASQQLLPAEEEVSSQDSLTDENSEQLTKIEETLLTKAKKGYEDQYVIWDDEAKVESRRFLELAEQETTEAELQQLSSEQSKRTEIPLEKTQQGYKDQIDVSSSEKKEEFIDLLQLREQDEKKQHEMRLTEKGEVKVDKTQIIEELIKDKQNREDHILAEARNVRIQKQNIQKIETVRGRNQNEEELKDYKQNEKAHRLPKQNLEKICLKPKTINNSELSTVGTVKYAGIKEKKIGSINVLLKNLDQVSKPVQNSVKKNVENISNPSNLIALVNSNLKINGELDPNLRKSVGKKILTESNNSFRQKLEINENQCQQTQAQIFAKSGESIQKEQNPISQQSPREGLYLKSSLQGTTRSQKEENFDRAFEHVRPDHLEKNQRILVQDLLMKDQNRIKQGSLEYLQKKRTFFGQRIASDAKFLIKINEKIKKLQKSGNLEIDNEGRVKIRLTKTFETAKTLKNKTIVELRNMRRAIIDEWNIPKTAFQFQKDKMNYKVHSNSKRWTVNLNPKVLRIKTVHGSGGTIVWIKPEGAERELQRLRKTFLAITEKIRKDTEYRKAFVNNKIKQAQEIRDIYEKIVGRNFDEDTNVVSNLFDQQKYMRILHIKTLNSPKSLLKHVLTKTNSLTKANTKFMKIMSIDDTENIIKENIVVEEVLKKHFRYSKPTTKCPKGLPYYDDVVNGIRNFNVFHETQGGIQTFVGNIRSGMAKIVDEINKINVRKSTEEIEAAIERVGYEISPLIRYMRLKIKNPTNVKIKYHVGGQSSKGVTGIVHYSCDGLIYEGKNLLGIIQIKVIGKNPHVTPSNIVLQTLELLYLKIKYQVPVAVVVIDELDDGKTLIYKWSCSHPLTKEASEINFKKLKRSFLDVMLFKGFQHDIIKNSILQPILENSIGKPLLSLRNALKNITDEDLWKVLRDTAENIFEDNFILEASSVKKYFDEFIDELIPSLTKRNLKDWNHFNEAWNTLLAKYFFRKYRRMTREIMVM